MRKLWILFVIVLGCYSFIFPASILVSSQIPDVNRLTNPCSYPSLNNHPLRPDPFNPCDPLIIQKPAMSFACGAGLTMNGTFEFPAKYIGDVPIATLDPNNVPIDTPAYTGDDNTQLFRCLDNPTQICAIQRIPFDVTFDFSGAQLPIMGNTQIENIDDATKMNNYLSWYLEGTVQQSEKNRPDYRTPDQIERIITFSGPIKKLLPRGNHPAPGDPIGITGIKNTMGSRIGQDLHNYKEFFGNIFSILPIANQEDIVGEAVVSVLPSNQPDIDKGGKIIPISWDIKKTSAENRNAMTIRILRNPTKNLTSTSPDSDGRLYMAHLRETAGLAESLRNYALPFPNPTPENELLEGNFRPLDTYPGYNPPGSTVSKIGCGDPQSAACKRLIGTWDKNNHQGDTPDSSDAVTQYSWNELNNKYTDTPTRNTEIIDNPLQRGEGINRVTQSGTEYPSHPGEPRPVANVAPAPDNLALAPPAPGGTNTKAFNANCSLAFPDSPGDALIDKNGWKINAKLTYTQIFRYDALTKPPGCNPNICIYTIQPGETECPLPSAVCGDGYECSPDTVDQSACNACKISGGSCDYICNVRYGKCVPRKIELPTKARVNIFTKTPYVERIYEDLISGLQSVLRRFAPARDQNLINNACNEYIKGETYKPNANPDSSCVRPASTSFAGATSGTGGTTADHKNIPLGGSIQPYSPTMLFPYIGSLQDYILGCGDETINLQKMLRPQGSEFKSICSVSGFNSNLSCSIPAQSQKANFATATCSSATNGPAGIGPIGLGPDSTKVQYDRMDIRIPPGRSLGIPDGETSADPGYTPDAVGVDPLAPNFRTLVNNLTPEKISSVYYVNGEINCVYKVNLVGFSLPVGTIVNVPDSGYDIQPRVLYADCDEITFTYQSTLDGITNGYTIHLLGLQVDQGIIAAYQSARSKFLTDKQLPILNEGQRVGVTTGGELQVGIRDSGSLMDLRARADWW